ncbi:MAG: sulfite oxidase [Gemmatimonadota bacterium]|nr:sulfite oxidase [Gemmatimonadota bacterium]
MTDREQAASAESSQVDRRPGRDDLDLVTREERPYNGEAPLEALSAPVTPTRNFYVRDHFPVPRIDPDGWRLRVEGEVDRTLSLSLEELRRLGSRTLAVTLECAGNGRRAMRPFPGGTPWRFGAVSTGEFTGAPLPRVLERAGVSPEAVEIVFTGADGGEVEGGREIAFERSLPVAVAEDPEVLLAWGMNGQPLSPSRGGPVRLVVPAWYGMASVKWLVAVRAVDEPFRGWFQAERYVYRDDAERPDGTPVTRKRVRAVIARPGESERLERGPVEVAGTAWSGGVGIRRVEVSADGGEVWHEARLGEPAGEHAATPWRWVWQASRSGRHVLVARATDEDGEIQPLEPRWNAHGYGNNVVHRVAVEVV